MRTLKLLTVAALGCGLLVPASATPAMAGGSVWSARQIDGSPPSFYWAVIIGATDYAGSTSDAVGAARDAYALRDHLLSLGWWSDHIYVVTNLSATRDGILKAIGWLKTRTTNRSLAIFHYSGHEKPFNTTGDGDSEARDVALWAADNRYILDGELGRELGSVRASRSWIHLSACRAGGFSDAGMSATNRVITYSSPESELSWADPALNHSLFSYFLVAKGMRGKWADLNHDGRVSVEEAFWYSRRPVMDATRGQQHPLMTDRFAGDFHLSPPKS